MHLPRSLAGFGLVTSVYAQHRLIVNVYEYFGSTRQGTLVHGDQSYLIGSVADTKCYTPDNVPDLIEVCMD